MSKLYNSIFRACHTDKHHSLLPFHTLSVPCHSMSQSYEKSKTIVLTNFSMDFDKIEYDARSCWLVKPMLSLLCTINIQGRKLDVFASWYDARFSSMSPVWMTLTLTQGHRVTRRLELVLIFCCKVALSSPTYAMVDYVGEITSKKTCKYSECGSFDQLLFSLKLVFILTTFLTECLFLFTYVSKI